MCLCLASGGFCTGGGCYCWPNHTKTHRSNPTNSLLKPFHPENFAEAVAGLLCCFYGGIFQLVVASAEAWRAASWEDNKKDLQVLYEVCGDDGVLVMYGDVGFLVG